jgi:hypothetical protein
LNFQEQKGISPIIFNKLLKIPNLIIYITLILNERLKTKTRQSEILKEKIDFIGNSFLPALFIILRDYFGCFIVDYSVEFSEIVHSTLR